ncbi:VTT domain-containing protein [Candidatus Peregrinibacteria bacterium]|nr:VTT domain-containing protein [Candidatus Peregrinibacteria bacterium]
MHPLIAFAKGIILAHGYFGIFVLTTFEQFILPIPSEVFMALGTSVGLNIKMILLMVVPATLLGTTVCYFLGKALGHPVVLWLFGQKKLDHAEQFIKKWGFWGVIIAGYTPSPFKLISWAAGIFEMPYSKFIVAVMLGRVPRYILVGLVANFAYQTKFYATPQMSAVLLGALQGLTEFLPISSSGHLVLMERFVKLPFSSTSQSMEVFDIFLHAGSLFAVLVYFWRDVIEVVKGVWQAITQRNWSSNLFIKLSLGTIPAIIASLLFKDALMGASSRSLIGIGVGFLISGAFYLFVEWKATKAEHQSVTLKNSVWMGLAQAIALVPSISRSGATIGAGLLLGLTRETAAKFSFLLGGVAILAANVYTLFSLRHGTVPWPDPTFSLIGITVSFLVSLAAIHWLIRFLHKHTLRPFAVYVILLGVLILTVFK